MTPYYKASQSIIMHGKKSTWEHGKVSFQMQLTKYLKQFTRKNSEAERLLMTKFLRQTTENKIYRLHCYNCLNLVYTKRRAKEIFITVIFCLFLKANHMNTRASRTHFLFFNDFKDLFVLKKKWMNIDCLKFNIPYLFLLQIFSLNLT